MKNPSRRLTPSPLPSPLRTALSLLLLITGLHAAPPDLTAPGVIDGINRTSTYNLGPTGLRGWIYVNRANVGDSGLMTDQSRQILVTTASAPANAVLLVDDVILGAIAASSGTVPDFTTDCRKAFAAAIADAEKTGAGTLRVKRWRAEITEDVNIPITILGNYTATAPFNCPKSSLILANARDQMVGELLANSSYLGSDYSGAIHALALLASVAPGDPNHATVQTRLQTFARARANAGAASTGLPIWHWSYTLLFLSEYYLLTGDSQVVAGIHNYTLTLANSQSIYGTYGHSQSAIRPDGTGRRVSIGYGPVNSAGVIANLAMVMGKKALQAASQSIDPEIDAAIERGSNFFAFFVNKGSIPYGEHEPIAHNHASNGKDPSAAVFFGIQPDRAVETEYYTRMSIATWIGREYGHTGQGFSYLWTALGANMGGAHAASEHLAQVRWHLDLTRRTDGSFTYDGQEQYGGGTTTGGTYLGRSHHYNTNPTAIYLLTYSLPLQRLYITGKKDPGGPDYPLDSTQVAHAVAAGSFRLDRSTKTIPQLFSTLGDYDPVIRHYTAVELAARTLSAGELTDLRNLLASPDPNIRQSACQALGIRRDTNALPTIVGLLSDPDLWVRSKAATAIRAYTAATASTYRDTMIDAFIANATDPDNIDWSDPIQMSNGKLSLALFGNAVPDGTPGSNIADYTINAPKQTHLYPALRVGLRQPDSYPRNGAARFARVRLPLADAQALYPEIVHVAAFDTPADRMWSGDCRAEAIRLMGNLKITEGIPLALAMLEVPENFGWGSGTYLVQALNALASYGDAARHTLPTLKGYLSKWSTTSNEYTALVNAIDTLENAITAPARNPGLCVANSQIVATSGAKAITLTGASPRAPGTFSFLNVTQPAHGTLTGTAPNLTYTPNPGFTGTDHFTFQTTDTLTTSASATVSIIAGPAGNGLVGEYFDNIDFTNLVITRTDPQINFDWGTGSPHASIGADTFSVRWSGALLIPESDNYTFSALTSDGIRVYINGTLVIDNFTDQSTRWSDGQPIHLTAGQMADLYVEYYENTGSAVAKLKWTGPSFAGDNGDIIPQAYLFDGSAIANRPAYAFPKNLTTNLNTALPVTLTGSGGTLSYQLLTQPSNGTISGTAPNLTYTPSTGFSGTDSFTFIVNNGTTNSLPATISLSIQAGTLTAFNWATATSGNWSDAAQWTPAAPTANGQSNYALNFTPTGTYTATHDLNNGFRLNQLTATSIVTLAGTQSITFSANGGSMPQLSQNSKETVIVNNPLTLESTVTLGGSGGGRVTLAGIISGNGGIVKNGAGILQIDQRTNSYTGGTILNTGRVNLPLGNGSATPALGSGTVIINPGTILSVNRSILSNSMVFNGGTVTGGNSFSSVFSGAITLNGITTFDFGTTGGFQLTGSLSGPGGFTFSGSPTSEFPFSGTNTHTGPNSILSGIISFPSANAVPPGALLINTNGKAKLNFTGTSVIESLTLDGTLMPPGTYGSTTSTATHKNDTYFTGNGTVTVPQPTTTALALTNGSTPANPGTPLTFTATVAGSSPTGSVQFFSGTTLLGSGTLNASQATFTTSQLAIGPHSITARYVGNSSNAPSTSAPLLIEINNAPVAAPAGLTATAAAPNINLAWTASTGATGYYVKRSTTSGGPYVVIALVTGTTHQDSTIVGGVTYHYVISAINAAGESADSNETSAFTGSASSTTTTLSSTPQSPGVYGTTVTITATVSASGSTPVGTVTFRNGVDNIGTANLSSGTASLVISTLAVATHSITASYEGTGAHDPSVSSALVYQVTPKPITITGVTASNKIYDATTAATLTSGTLSGVVGGETVTLTAGTGTFSNANVGTWTITATGYSLGGPHAARYTLSAQPAVPDATITARPIHITGTKTYDATTAIPTTPLAIDNNVDGGNLALSGTAELSAKDAGDQTLITVTGTAQLARIQSAKAGTSGNSTSLAVTLPAPPTNGNTLIAVISTRGTSADRVSSITGGGVTWSRVSQAINANGTTSEIWHGPDVSSGTTGIIITTATSLHSAAVVMEYSGLRVPASFDVAANHTGSGTAASTGTTATTSQASQLWIGGIGTAGSSPNLDSLTNSFVAVDNAASSSGSPNGRARIHALERIATTTGAATTGGTLSATAQWSGAIATFRAAADSPLSLTGSAAANYTLVGMTSSITVTPKALTVSGLTASDRTYDGTTTALLTGTPALATAQAPGAGTSSDGTPYTGDAISLGGTASGNFATKHADTGKPITVSGLTIGGAQAANYTLTTPDTLTATVSPRPVTVSAVDATKTYDGTTTASGTPTIDPALFPGDTASVLSQAFETPTVGTANKVIIPTITIDDGNGGNNYAVTLVNFTTGTILDDAPSPYEAWLAAYPDLTDTDPTANPDGDSLNNMQEFAFGTNPMGGQAGPIVYEPGGSVTTPGIPVPHDFGTPQSADYRAVFARRKDYQAAGLTYIVQFTADLQTWTDSTPPPTLLTGPENTADVDAVSVPFPATVPAAGGDSQPTFFRVSVAMP